ncbi:hypothetical protein BC834DRAFT_337054 [Gloeopeniophorella convolvens]|nr:hypothetical protein BC834DRAFT_337054 [Gloeopeniophorella convolvens]
MNMMNRSIPTLTPTKISHPMPAPYPDFSRHSSVPIPVQFGRLRGPKPALHHGAAYGAFGQQYSELQPPFNNKYRTITPQPGTAASPGAFGGLLGASGDRSSTASPELPAMGYAPPIPPPHAVMRRQISSLPSDESDVRVVPEEAVPFAEPASVVRESSLAATVEGASGIPSDDAPHKVSVAVLPFNATIAHVAVPKAQPAAYREARVTNTSDYRFLPGPVRAFVDDSFVSETALEDVAPGEAFRCALGVGPAAQVRYARTAARAARALPSPFGKQWATTLCASRTTVANRRPFALHAFVLRDCVPTPEDEERVSIVLRRPPGFADLEQGKDLEVDVDGKKRTVRWSKLVEGKGGKTAYSIGRSKLAQERRSRSRLGGTSASKRSPRSCGLNTSSNERPLIPPREYGRQNVRQRMIGRYSAYGSWSRAELCVSGSAFKTIKFVMIAQMPQVRATKSRHTDRHPSGSCVPLCMHYSFVMHLRRLMRCS